MTRLRTPIALATILAAAAAVTAPAIATPSAGFTRVGLSLGLLEPLDVRARNDADDRWEARLRTKENTDVGIDQLTIVDGGHSGWHTHAGLTLVTVTAGEVVWYDGASSDCTATIYRVGDSFVEEANHVHLVHNRSGATASFTAVQIRPQGTAGRIDAAQPANCPVF